MMQTVKFARHRAAQDPDRGAPLNDYRGKGVYFGSNMTSETVQANPAQTIERQRTTHGACA